MRRKVEERNMMIKDEKEEQEKEENDKGEEEEKMERGGKGTCTKEAK